MFSVASLMHSIRHHVYILFFFPPFTIQSVLWSLHKWKMSFPMGTSLVL
uniref:Uncharacterized protein n=1 Tax=Rhizophora mucronata TaxID=61149 RepID=A0A2P2P775_RHIMU